MNANTQIHELLAAGWRAHAVSAAAQLKVADGLAAGPLTAPALAAKLKCDASMLERLLRVLVSVDVVKVKGGEFALTPVGEALRDRPGSARAFAALQTREFGLLPFGRIADAVREGEVAFKLAHGVDFFDWMRAHPAEAQEFAAAMESSAGADVAGITAVADFGRFRRFVDVGGGRGALLISALTRSPQARGVLFDLPHVVQHAPAHERLERVGGDLFESVPGEGDAYLLKSVLHDFDDAKAKRILERVKAAMPKGATLLVCERLVQERGYARSLDVVMLTLLGGRERTEAELRGLIEGAGFKIARVASTGEAPSVIEARS